MTFGNLHRIVRIKGSAESKYSRTTRLPNYRRYSLYSQTVLVVAAEEQGLTPEILDRIIDGILCILTLGTGAAHALVEGLLEPGHRLLWMPGIDVAT